MKAKELAKLNNQTIVCKDGPLKGQPLRFSVDGCTLTFTLKGQTGHYVRGIWHAVS